MPNEGSQQGLIALKRPRMPTGREPELIEIEESRVGHRIHLEVTPERFDRVQLRGIRREKGRSHFGMAIEESASEPCAVCLETIPDQPDRIAQLVRQLSQESADMRRSDICVRMETEIEPYRVARGRDT